MHTTTRTRIGVAVAAAAVFAGGLLATAPAHAENEGKTGTLTLENSVFIEGNWDTGLTITGEGFTPSPEVVDDDNPANDVAVKVSDTKDLSVLGSTSATVDQDGKFEVSFVPDGTLVLPEEGKDIVVTANSIVEGFADNSAAVNLTVLAKAGSTVAAKSLTADELGDESKGLGFSVAGFEPDEEITFTVTLDDKSIKTFTAKADRAGSYTGTIVAAVTGSGELKVVAEGAKHTETFTAAVTAVSDEDSDEDADEDADADEVVAPGAAPTVAVSLPVVSG